MKNKISIIVPIYNSEKYLNKCIDSLINQTEQELEIILINDGSTDNTEKIIKKYKDPRIKYYKNDNHGIGYTRNFGIDKSSGEYIMFVDSDDSLSRNSCEELLKKAKSSNCDMVICDFYKEYDNGKISEEKLYDFQDTALKDKPELLTKINLSPWNKLYKRDLLIDNDIKFIENLKYEDAPFVVNAMKNANKIGKVNECLNYYYIRNNSETTVRDEKCFDILEIIKIIRNDIKSQEYREELNKLTVRMITNYTIQQRNQKDINVGMRFIDEAFEYMSQEITDYKNNKYYRNRNLFQKTIEKNKTLTKLYCRCVNKKFAK